MKRIIIKNEEQYQRYKLYVLYYINTLLQKHHIRQKDKLRLAYYDIEEVGYIKTRWEFNLVSKFLMCEPFHKDMNWDEVLDDFSGYVLYRREDVNTLDKFFV